MPAPYRLPKIFETRRYRLRPSRPDDAKAIFASYAADPAVTRFLGWRPHQGPGETRDFLARVSAEWEDGRGFPAVVTPRDAPEDVIGMFHPHLAGSRISYGYVLARRSWGQGCASEVLAALVDHALAHPVIFRAEAFCDMRNVASARVMEKAGMAREAVLRRYFLHPNISPEPSDCFLYARVR